MKHKGLMIILDGLGDRPHADLGHKTPLEAARTPNLDALMTRGLGGMVTHLLPFLPVGTHTGTGLLMGLKPSQAKLLSRGPVEAFGAGVALQTDDLAIRGNLASLVPDESSFRILDRRAGRVCAKDMGVHNLLKDFPFPEGVNGWFEPTTSHRIVLVLRGTGLSPKIADTDPGAGNENGLLKPTFALDGQAYSKSTAYLVNQITRWTYEKLVSHPKNLERRTSHLPEANGVLFRGAGTILDYQNILRRYNLSIGLVSGEKTVTGLAKMFGFEVFSAPEFTANTDTNLDRKMEMVQRSLSQNDLTFLHIKGTDIASHDQKPDLKRVFLERVDQSLSFLGENLVIGVTGDHSTDCHTGRHTGDPVPSLLVGPSGRRDSLQTFDESTCLRGGLGQISATSFLLAMCDLMNVSYNFKAGETVYF